MIQLYQAGQYEQAVERIRLAYDTRYVPSPFPALDALAHACIQQGDFAAAEPLISLSVGFKRQIFGEEHPAVLESLVTKALIANKLGKIEVAREIFEQILQMRRRVLPKDHPDVIASLDDLARFYYEHGDPNAAEPLLLESIEIHRGVSGEEDPTLAEKLNMLAEIYIARDEPLLAEPLLREELDTLRKALGEYHPNLANILVKLSSLYLNTRNFAAAEWTNNYILELVRRIVGEKHPLYATSLERMAQLKDAMGQYPLAEPLYLQALQIRREVLGENSPEVADTLKRLADLYQETGEYSKAEPLYQQALSIQQKTLSSDNPSVAQTLNALGVLYMSIGKPTEAEPLLLRSREIERKHNGDKAPSVAMVSSNLASLYQQKGDYEAAERLFHETLTIQREHYGEAHPAVADTLSNLATLYGEMSRYEEAEKLFHQTLDIQRNILGENHPYVASTALRLAHLYDDMKRYDMAERSFLEALHIRQSTFGENNPLVAEVLLFLAHLYFKMNNYNEAEAVTRQLVAISGEAWGEQDSRRILALKLLANLCEKKKDYSNAISLYSEVLAVQRQISGENYPDVTDTLNSLATLYSQMGEYAQAEPLLREAIDIQSKSTSDHDNSLVGYLLNLGQLYTAINDYKQAVSVFQRAFDILTTVSENRLEVAVTLSSLGQVYHNLGDLQAAKRFYLHALKIRRRVANEDLWSQVPLLSSLGALYEMREEYTEARSYLDQALSIGQKLHRGNDPAYATILNNLARLEHAQGSYAEAASNLRQAIAICEANYDIPRLLKLLYNIAEIYAAIDQPDDALECMKRATTLENRIIGQIFSIGTEKQRMAHLQAVRSKMSMTLSLIVNSFMNSRQGISTALNLVLQRKALAADALAAQRDTILRGKYQHLQSQLQMLALLRSQLAQRMLAGPDQEESDVYQRHLEEDTAGVEQLEAELARQIPEMNLEQTLRSTDYQAVAVAIPEGAVLIEFVRFSLFDFKAVRSRGEFYWKSDRYLAFVLPSKEPANLQMIDLGEADLIDHLISTWRVSITSEADNRHLSPAKQPSQTQSPGVSVGTDLCAAVFDPLLPSVKGCKRLFIAPDGDLTQIPFEVLPTNNERYLIDEYQISYLSTGRDLLRFESKTIDQSTPPVVVADPDFDLELDRTASTTAIKGDGQQQLPQALRQSGLHFNRLPGTRLEGERIAQMLGIQPLSGKSALESSLKTCHSPQILHLATHGFFLKYQRPVILNIEDLSVGMIIKPADPQLRIMALDDIMATPTEFVDASHEDEFSRLSGQGLENPMLRSGLALAGANTWLKGDLLPTEAEDAILTAEDVSGMDLVATELVVLSACETGLGEIQVGEGVFGLRRAFILAGAKTLVMSLWKVPDQQTQELMIDFYQRILSGQSYIDALRAAQLATKAKHPDPFYWGAFIFQGDPGSLFKP